MNFATVKPTERVSALSKEFAENLDAQSKTFRDQFLIPKVHQVLNNVPVIYLCGNSLGLQPINTRKLLNEELDVWAQRGVNGHFDHPLNRPWVTVDDLVTASSAKLVGAKKDELAIMNSLTPNLHLMMVPFYRPNAKRFKILMESKAFPSDYFAFESQVKFHGLDPATAIIQVAPKEGSFVLETSAILEILEKEGDSISLVLFSGVQYYTGQLFDMKTITRVAQSKGCIVGWDLAHAVGNVKLELHEWNVDFACWCSYKYLNSGPGGIGGVFVHEKHSKETLPRFAGWWGSNPDVKFTMGLDFQPIEGAYGYRLSNPSVLCVIALRASLDVFDQTSMDQLTLKSKDLTNYLEYLLLNLIPAGVLKIITPTDPEQRGCQLSLYFLQPGQMQTIFGRLSLKGIICDERKPDVLRVAPTPLYNTFADVWNFVAALKESL